MISEMTLLILIVGWEDNYGFEKSNCTIHNNNSVFKMGLK